MTTNVGLCSVKHRKRRQQDEQDTIKQIYYDLAWHKPHLRTSPNLIFGVSTSRKSTWLSFQRVLHRIPRRPYPENSFRDQFCFEALTKLTVADLIQHSDQHRQALKITHPNKRGSLLHAQKNTTQFPSEHRKRREAILETSGFGIGDNATINSLG